MERPLFPGGGIVGQWLSGHSLLAVAAGYLGVWSLFHGLRNAVGTTRTTRFHPRIMRPINVFRGTFFVAATLVVLLLRANSLGESAAEDAESLLEELVGFVRGAVPRGPLLFFIEDLLAAVLVYALARLGRGVWRVVVSPVAEKKAFITDRGFELVRHLPAVSRRLESEVRKTEAHLEATLRPGGKEGAIRALPATGRPGEDVLAEMQVLAEAERAKWGGGQASGAIYNGNEDHMANSTQAYRLFSHSNPLHPDLWPSGLKFESEVISMTARLLDGGDGGVCGVLTSGGTESILLATKAHRDFYRQRGVTEPEIVAATTAHAAIDKACDLMGIRLIKVPVNSRTMKAEVRATAKAMSADTIMIYASAPSFPHGMIDPVEELSELALQHGCGLHVDCCLGGFVLPFAKRLGYSVTPFDFSVKGVTSMSADTHKYGYAPKGTSVALFRRKEAYFCFPDWTGGLYVTPTVAGSRPGGLTAACWAAMVSMGEDGYTTAVKGIMDTAREVADGVPKIEGLSLVGDPMAMVVCFRGDAALNIYKVGDSMSHRGWSLNALQHPPCLHLCVTSCHVGKARKFLSDLEASAVEASVSSGKESENSTAAVYGMASSMPAGPVNVLLRAYTDVTLGGAP